MKATACSFFCVFEATHDVLYICKLEIFKYFPLIYLENLIELKLMDHCKVWNAVQLKYYQLITVKINVWVRF